jgi:hypothetical protein
MNNECAVIKIDNWRDPLPDDEEDKDDSKMAKGGINNSLNKSKSHNSASREVEAELGFE